MFFVSFSCVNVAENGSSFVIQTSSPHRTRGKGGRLSPNTKPGQPKSPVYSREVLSGTGTTGSVVKIRLAASSSKATPVNRSSAVQRTDPTKSDASVRVNISSMNTTQAAAGPFRSGNQRRHLLARVL